MERRERDRRRFTLHRVAWCCERATRADRPQAVNLALDKQYRISQAPPVQTGRGAIHPAIDRARRPLRFGPLAAYPADPVYGFPSSKPRDGTDIVADRRRPGVNRFLHVGTCSVRTYRSRDLPLSTFAPALR